MYLCCGLLSKNMTGILSLKMLPEALIRAIVLSGKGGSGGGVGGGGGGGGEKVDGA